MLWNVGSIYVLVLLFILIAGLGIAGAKLITQSAESLQGMLTGKKVPAGGDKKPKSPWLNYAAVAFAGIIISYFALGLSAVNQSNHDHNHGGNNQGVVQNVGQPGSGMGGQVSPQVSPLDVQLQSLNSQLNYLDFNMRAMEAQHFNGY